ncbi:hypothetical protein IEZ26_01550 [Nocardioides cavernae]|uniref:Uncharacterized protein n=1 Tax=Nocardioides cavernae TaxID=1921566 RepID=A0ABR8N541_9ACTN|nr:hypothetical protein [Nocardioides cavernae]MBD3923291.1 hypothetical protein [Nocardioides cavernae]MBM7511787.1 hypothetical protein [Nocardioides cavernae]
MSLQDLTSTEAVLAAIEECDKLGRDAFLDRYGFGEARTYFLEYGGRRYDSKAIAGVAYGKQHARPLRSEEFSGGHDTVARKLTGLGFYVTQPDRRWTTPIGAVMTKAEITSLYGGSIYGGIEPSNTSPNVMLYTDPSEGVSHGYKFDEWAVGEPGVFYYTGEGRFGDQELTHGNRAILEHDDSGRVLRLWAAVDGKQQPGGKLHRYVGAFAVDPEAPYVREDAPDTAGDLRKVLVFRLLAAEVLGYPQRPVAQPSLVRASASSTKPIELCDVHFLQKSVTGVCPMCDE